MRPSHFTVHCLNKIDFSLIGSKLTYSQPNHLLGQCEPPFYGDLSIFKIIEGESKIFL